VNITILAHNLD
jgi:hypothetical protein